MKHAHSLSHLCAEIATVKLGWGDSQHWTNADFDSLSEQLLDETGVSLSTSTLKRLWGRVPYDSTPQTATLNALANFAGYASFRAYSQRQSQAEPEQAGLVVDEPIKPLHAPESARSAARRRFLSRSGLWAVGVGTGLLLSLLIAFSLRTSSDPALARPVYVFSSHRVTKGIPNSVVFNFDVSGAPTDCLAIQQSWDPARRFRVRKDQHEATSIYYYPGFFRAKLLVGGRVVREHKLLIATTDWLILMKQDPVPVYLSPGGIVTDTVLRVPLSRLVASRVALQPQPAYLNYYNVGNFQPVRTDDFDFVTQVRQEYRAGASVCQHASIGLLTEAGPIIIPLSAKGCVAELTLLSVDRQLSGKQTDLSAFGVDFSRWVTVRCRGNARSIRFYVDGRLARELPAPRQPTRIVGLGYGFVGTGAVREIALRTGNQLVYQGFTAKPDATESLK